MKTDFWVSIAICLIVFGIGLIVAQPQTVSPMYTLSIERLDFVSIDQQTQFQTNVPARTNFVEVFENGLLQTETVDYSKVSVTGHLVVTFLTPLSAGQRVSLIYWR